MQAIFERKSFPFFGGVFIGQLLQLPHKCLHVTEFPVHGRKTDICHGIPFFQLFHSQLAQFAGGNFPAHPVHQLCLNFIGQCLCVHGTFLAGFQKTAQKFIPLKAFLGAVFLNDQRLERLHKFICGETLLASFTLTFSTAAYTDMTLHRAGAWVGDDGIITCDWRSYDLQSEDFNISMLKHEAQHVMDLRRWPDISSEGLEYRAYLTELIYYETENRLIHFDNSASPDDPGNEYACAAYYVCNDFYQHFQTDDFAAIPIPEIQEYAKELLRRSTQQCLEAFPEST